MVVSNRAPEAICGDAGGLWPIGTLGAQEVTEMSGTPNAG